MGLYRWAAAESLVLHAQAGRLCRWHAASGSQKWPLQVQWLATAQEETWSCGLLIVQCLC